MSPRSTSARSGIAVVELGGGRARADDAIDPAVGLTELAALGAESARTAPLALVHARDEPTGARRAAERLRAAYRDRRRAARREPDPVIERIARARHERAARRSENGTRAPWRARLEALLPVAAIATLGELFDRASVRYGLSWRHPPGRARGPAESAGDLLARRGRRSSVRRSWPARRADRARRRSRSRDRMSEWVVMQALIHLRQFRRYERQQRERVWADDDDQPSGRRRSRRRSGPRRDRHGRGDASSAHRLQGRRLERDAEIDRRNRMLSTARTASTRCSSTPISSSSSCL